MEDNKEDLNEVEESVFPSDASYIDVISQRDQCPHENELADLLNIRSDF
jgi:hypothetical protein